MNKTPIQNPKSKTCPVILHGIKNQFGFTLLEILVALALIGFFSVPMYRLIKAQGKLIRQSRDKETAINIAQHEAEIIRLSTKLKSEFEDEENEITVDNKNWIVKRVIARQWEEALDPFAPVQIDIQVFKPDKENPLCKISVLK